MSVLKKRACVLHPRMHRAQDGERADDIQCHAHQGDEMKTQSPGSKDEASPPSRSACHLKGDEPQNPPDECVNAPCRQRRINGRSPLVPESVRKRNCYHTLVDEDPAEEDPIAANQEEIEQPQNNAEDGSPVKISLLKPSQRCSLLFRWVSTFIRHEQTRFPSFLSKRCAERVGHNELPCKRALGPDFAWRPLASAKEKKVVADSSKPFGCPGVSHHDYRASTLAKLANIPCESAVIGHKDKMADGMEKGAPGIEEHQGVCGLEATGMEPWMNTQAINEGPPSLEALLVSIDVDSLWIAA